MLGNQKCSSWSVCEITLQSQEFNCRQGCFLEGSVDGGRRRKRNGRSGLFLPFSSKHDWVRTFPHCPLWALLCSLPHKELLFHGCCCSCLLVTPLSHCSIPREWQLLPESWSREVILCATTDSSWIEKKRLLQSWAVTEHWTLSLGVPRPGAQWLKCSCSTSFVECVVFRGKF